MKALFALGLVCAAVAGCSGASSGPVTPPMEMGAYAIHMLAGNHFSPADAKVPANSTVMWVAQEGINHDVTDSDHSSSDSAYWSSDKTLGHKMSGSMMYEKLFLTPGVYHYYCTIHGQAMSGTITVE
ncbi:MAG: plastocyanin/azurin family copper-binding protein [bacterium]